MPLLRKAVLIPVKGIDFSQPGTFLDERAGLPTNMRYYRAELRKRPGKTLYGAAMGDNSQVMNIGRMETNSEVKYLLRVSKRNLQRYNSGTGLWETIGNAFTGGDSNLFSFATVTEDGLFIITNGYDNIYKWPGSGNVSLLGGTPPKARYCCYLSPYLLLAYTDDGVSVNPWKIVWCDTNDPENWSTGNSGEALISDEASPIMNIAKLNEFVAVYKKESLWLGRKVDPPTIFEFECIKTGVGLAAPRAFADAEGQHYFMGLNDFYVWNGIRVEPIGEKIRDEVFSIINRNYIQRCFALHIQELNEIWFFIVASGDNWPKHIYKYNYRIGYWFYDTCSEITAASKGERVDSQDWDTDTGTWDSDDEPWDSGVTVQDWEEIVFGDKDGKTYKLDYTNTDDNNVAVSSSFVSKDFTGDQLEFNKRWLKIDIWAKGVGKLWVDYSIDEGSTWINVPYTSSQAYVSLGSEYAKNEFYFDVWSDKIRFRLRNNVSGETFYIRNFYPYYLGKEEIAGVR